ncbi:MAG: serine/threonine protein kinase [Deltaproteobacteria bacterium]|nr:serine/threonine protein kinase [Kofleriaceae bacterium]
MVAMKYGSYVLGDEIGRGGMGVVYKAQHAVLKKPACVKLLLSEFTRHPEIVTRFVNEAVAASGLRHPNIVEVLDCEQGADGVWYIALEFLKGVPLSKWIRGETAAGVAARKDHQGYPIAPAQVCRVLVQAASALHKAHTHSSDGIAGIVHRDVKPDNIFLIQGEGAEPNDLHVKLLDFGIAKLRPPAGEGMTRMGAVIGTPSYMAPEQLVNSKLVDARADLYALGIVLYEMLTGGWIPWYATDGTHAEPGDIYHRQVTEPPPDPRVRNPNVSPELARFVARSLACDPRQRPSSALEWARMLAELIHADGVHPGGREILRRFAPDLYDHNDSMFGHRLSAEPVTRPDEPAWQPPVSAVSIVPSASLRPPPAAPSTTLGASAAQSVPVQVPPRRSRRGLYAATGALVAAGGIVAAIAFMSGGTATFGNESNVATPTEAAGSALPAPADVSVAVLTDPVGAAVFVDDELVGTSPTKVQLARGRSVKVRAELAGHSSTEIAHVVGDRAETVRLTLAPPVDAALPIDAGIDGAPTTRNETGRRTGGTRKPPTGAGSGSAPASGSSGSGSKNTFDPEGIAR